jgi:hypothetical protein
MVMTEQEMANVGPRELKEIGSPAWCWQTVGLLQNLWGSIDRNVERYVEVWESVVEQRAWEKIPQEEPFGSLEVMKEKLKVGDAVEARARTAQLAVQAKPLNRRGGDRKRNQSNVRNFDLRGNTPEYLAARIARDHPDIYERMQNGEFKSAAEAARAAGILKTPPQRVGLLADVDRVAANIRKHYTPEQVRALKDAL